MTKHYNGKNWLEIVGKEKLQTFSKEEYDRLY